MISGIDVRKLADGYPHAGVLLKKNEDLDMLEENQKREATGEAAAEEGCE